MYQNGINVGIIKLNETTLKNHLNQNLNFCQYYDTNFTLPVGVAHWKVSGINTYFGFDAYMHSDFPIYTSCSTLPDTIDFSKNIFVVNLNGLSNTDDIEISLEDASSLMYSAEKKLTFPNVQAIFSYQEMKTVFPNYSGNPRLRIRGQLNFLGSRFIKQTVSLT